MTRDPLKEPKFGDVFVRSMEPGRPVMYVCPQPFPPGRAVGSQRGFLGVDLVVLDGSLLGDDRHGAYFSGPGKCEGDIGEWLVVEAAE